jgi:type IV pilus assembly protein PilZ
MVASESDRRNNKRIPVKHEVVYLNIEGLISDYTVNISRGGIFIATDAPLDLGTIVQLELKLSGSVVPVDIVGEVAWITKPDRNSSLIIPGMGVEFRNLNAKAKKSLELFIKENS